MPIASLVLENLSGQTIFLLIEAKDGGVIKFFLHSSLPEDRQDGSVCHEILADNALTVNNRKYSSCEIYNATGGDLEIKTVKHGIQLHYILLKKMRT